MGVESIKVLMFGWEFPPYTSGGLGTACFGLTKGLSSQGVDVTFLVPKTGVNNPKSHVHIISARDSATKYQLDEIEGVEVEEINSLLQAYITSKEYHTRYLQTSRGQISTTANSDEGELYGSNLYEEVYRYAKKAYEVCMDKEYDIIHAHDWMTYPAGINAKQKSGKPLVLHIHATEFDRTAGNPNQMVYEIEREGFLNADIVIAVSELTRQTVIQKYSIPPEKVRVVHNGVDISGNLIEETFPIKRDNKIVLFLGRITIQKGPEHFLWAADKVSKYDSKIKFVVAGSGDMQERMITEVASRGLSDRFIFTGHLNQQQVMKAYQMADLYVMPSLSEPFGIAPLEAMSCGTPTIISKQSGVSEVIRHCLKVDFWDIDQMANKILGVLNHKELQEMMTQNARTEVNSINWNVSASKCLDTYNYILNR